MAEYEDTIIDVSKPNAGRVYDYLIGGNHNFDVDKYAGDKLLEMAPIASDYAKLTRWFLGVGIRRGVEFGFTQFLDFASGLPTEDHIHENTPAGTKVIYSDIDPVTVDYGKDIIGENNNVKYVLCDASKPEKLLKTDAIKTLFGDNHRAAIGMNGICWFLKDEQIDHTMNILYEWAEPGSILFLTELDSENITKDMQAILQLYKNMNQPMYQRSKNTLLQLAKPWKLEDPGLLTLEKWIGMEPTVTTKSIATWGGGGLYAGFFRK
jgi:O-methyltransferase involved in polyketide biosynthesis